MTCDMAEKSGTSVPGFSGNQRVAQLTISTRRGSTTMSFAPWLATAAFICSAIIGWVSAVFDVVGAKKRAEKLLQEIVVFVGCLGAAVYRHGIGAVALENLDESAGGIIEGLVPGDLAPLIAIKGLCARARRLRGFADERRRYPVLTVNKIVAETSFDAQVAVVDRPVKRRGHFVDVIVLDMQLEIASDATVRARRRDHAIGRNHGDFLRRFFPPLVVCTISLRSNPRSSSVSRLGLSAPVGQTPTHWPQNTQVVSGMGLSKNVPILVSKPRLLKLIAWVNCASSAHT